MKRRLDSDRLLKMLNEQLEKVSERERKAKEANQSMAEMAWWGAKNELEQVAFWINLISTEELEDESNQVRSL